MAIGFTIKKAKREMVKVKIALMSPSGGGKTFSSLRLATGMAEEIEKETGKKAKIAMINTESNRGYYYANEFDYDILDLDAPFSPERYIDAINYVVSEGYDILIIDSTSHEWEGKGGCLELQARAGGKYQDWAKITPRHTKFIDTLSSSPIHIIATMRGKDQYDMQKDDNGKTSVQKLGIGAKQREGFEYEFTCTFNIDQKTSVASVQKDNTHIFDSESDQVLTEEHGAKIIKWANSGEAPAPKKAAPVKPAPVVEEVEETVDLGEDEVDLSSFGIEEEVATPEVDVEALQKEFAAQFKNCKDPDLKKEIAAAIKEHGKVTNLPLDVLQDLMAKLA